MPVQLRHVCSALMVALILTVAAPAAAVILPVQGILRANGGGPVSDGTYAMTFRLYASADAEIVLWDEVKVAVAVADGLFVETLGTSPKSPLAADLFTQNDALWVGVQIAADPELPRGRLDPVPYAVRALAADSLIGGLDGAQLADGSVAGKAIGFTYASSDAKAGDALGLKCTGCITLGHLGAGVLTDKNIQRGAGDALTTVAAALDGVAGQFDTIGKALHVQGAQVGLGKVPAGQCGVDIASDSGPLCVDGEIATLVRYAANADGMAKFATEGQIVFRSDEKRGYMRAEGAWRQIQFVAACGDSKVDPPETCDDGNKLDGDGCTAVCQVNVCGDGVVWIDKEVCDDGNDDPTDACVACEAAKCGDGQIQAGVEVCDGDKIGSATCESELGAGFSGEVVCGVDCKALDASGCKGPLGSESNPAATCKAIKDDQAGAKSGPFWLVHGEAKAKVWCDMETGGGGWLLALAWDTAEAGKVWGKFSTGLADPTPAKKHATPFVELIAKPTEWRIVYTGNGQSVAGSFAGGATWQTSGNNAYMAASDGRSFVIADYCSSAGFCINNGAAGGHSCDGNSGQINGQGLYNSCSYDEFCSCAAGGWKITGNCSPSVCPISALVTVYLR